MDKVALEKHRIETENLLERIKRDTDTTHSTETSVLLKMYKFLFKLQQSGKVNMMDASPLLHKEFPQVYKELCDDTLLFWMEHYEDIRKNM